MTYNIPPLSLYKRFIFAILNTVKLLTEILHLGESDMKIVIIGIGKVGFALAGSLSIEGHRRMEEESGGAVERGSRWFGGAAEGTTQGAAQGRSGGGS